MSKGSAKMSEENNRRATLLEDLIGVSVAGQATVGFAQMWKRSDLYLSVKTDKDLFNFVALVSQANSAEADAKMQEFYKAVQAYHRDPGHVDDLEKIQACLQVAIEALEVKKISAQAVEQIRQRSLGAPAVQAQSPASVLPTTSEEPEANLPEITKIHGNFPTKEEFVDSLKDQQVSLAERSVESHECMHEQQTGQACRLQIPKLKFQ